MGLVRQKVGEVLGISLQAFDGAEDLYPQVIMRDSGGSVLGTYDLPHVGNGMYALRSFLMPNNAIVTAQYKVYSDAGHTVLNEDYEDAIDHFIRDETSSQSGIVDGTIIGTVDDSEEIIGVVDLGNYDPIFLGYVEGDTAVGIVEEDVFLYGFVEGDEVYGIVEEAI